MLSLGSTPQTCALRADLRGHLGGQEAGPGADVEHPLAGLQREQRAGRAALLDDVRRLVGRLDLLGGLVVELEHAHNALMRTLREPCERGFRRPAPLASLRAVTGLTLLASGKVRELYDLGDDLLMVASDRISTYDVVHPTPIPDKGKVLTALSVAVVRPDAATSSRTTCSP